MRSRTRPSLGVVLLSAALVLGCASSGGSAAAAEDRVVPPRMITRSIPPALRITNVPASGRAAIRVEYEVLIDAEGRPDMKTFRTRGIGAAENHDALARWIEASAFAPATQAGRPVVALYSGSLAVRVRRTR